MSAGFVLGSEVRFSPMKLDLGRLNKDQHALHVQTAVSSPCYGVKKQCPCYHPDVLHDILEGIVSLELALSFDDQEKLLFF